MAILDGAVANCPYGHIWVKDNAVATTLNSAAKVQIDKFANNGESFKMSVDHTNDHMIVLEAGVYEITAYIACANGAGAAHVLEVDLYINNGATLLSGSHINRTLGAGTDVGAMAIGVLADLAVNDTIELWADTSRGSDTDVTFSDLSMIAKKIK